MQKATACILSLAILIPFLFLLALSLANGWRFPELLPESWTLAHWQWLVGGDGGLLSSLGLSMGLSLTVAILATATGFLTSRYIAFSPYRFRYTLMAYAPFVLSPVIYAACLHYYFIKMGLSGNLGGVFVGQLMIAYPYAVIICVGHWNEQLRSMEQLVLTLGGTERQAWWRVIVPYSRAILLVCFFQTFLISWFEYGLTTLIGVGKVQTLTLKVFQFVNEAHIYLAALSSWLLFLPPAMLLWFNKRYVFRPLH